MTDGDPGRPSGPLIRAALPDDAAAAALCHLRCWQEGYAGLLAADYLDGLDADLDRRTRQWDWMIGAGPPQVAVSGDGEIVGFASAGAGDDDLGDLLQLAAMYVRKAYWGTGLAQRLLDLTVGRRDASLWVFEDNARACRFYGRNGFVPDGRSLVREQFGLTVIRMIRRA